MTYLDTHRLLPATQSGFRRGHSTETATTRALSDLLDSVDRDDTAAPVLLDLTAAFDTVDHEILLKRLRVTFGVDSIALSCFRPTSSVASNMSAEEARAPLLRSVVAPVRQRQPDLRLLSAATSSLSTDISLAVDSVST